ncbi:uncharacterized protein LOC133516966 isoform X1 [Cydia pomonella]|uniref:uncharacterized protein LOC133516966 isoform X1 n=1 Tax=Cydia pomonella TaxID=82600 RepID=UPI002ADE50B1|nr:uncharacterized protein LOC133516966 isoform X1 [Cydia pomonella]
MIKQYGNAEQLHCGDERRSAAPRPAATAALPECACALQSIFKNRTLFQYSPELGYKTVIGMELLIAKIDYFDLFLNQFELIDILRMLLARAHEDGDEPVLI